MQIVFKNQRELFEPLELLHQRPEECALLYLKITSHQPSTTGKDGFRPQFKKTAVIFETDPNKM
jgi:hypothetical protein